MFFLKKRFQWRDRSGKFHYVKDMETRYLFYTVRMVWNHTAPPAFRLTPFHKYSFSSFYSKKYVQKAVKEMVRELRKRKDLEQSWIDDLNWMVAKSETSEFKKLFYLRDYDLER